MTQLFDTETYEDINEMGGASEDRHLRSLPTGNDIAERTTQWRLDDKTIETGRKGIQAAREALQAAARDKNSAKSARKAA